MCTIDDPVVVYEAYYTEAQCFYHCEGEWLPYAGVVEKIDGVTYLMPWSQAYVPCPNCQVDLHEDLEGVCV